MCKNSLNMTENILTNLPYVYNVTWIINDFDEGNRHQFNPFLESLLKWELYYKRKENGKHCTLSIYLDTDFCKQRIAEDVFVRISLNLKGQKHELADTKQERTIALANHYKMCSDLENVTLLTLDLSSELKTFLFPGNFMTAECDFEFSSNCCSEKIESQCNVGDEFGGIIKFRVGEVIFSSSKAILRSKSVFFKLLFENSPEIVCLEVPDCEPKVFEKFLNYLCFGVLEDETPNMITSLYSLSLRYKVPSLKKDCEQMYGKKYTNLAPWEEGSCNKTCENLISTTAFDDRKVDKFHDDSPSICFMFFYIAMFLGLMTYMAFLSTEVDNNFKP